MDHLKAITKVLIGSPISRNKEILNEFLYSLKNLDKTGLDVHYYFVDDNTELESSRLLKTFKSSENKVSLIISNKTSNNYIHNDYTHIWNNSLIKKISTFKNNMIQYAIDNNFDYLFFIDSDIILNDKVLKQLISDEKDIVSNIFWTSWVPNSIPEPQVWLQDEYSFFITESQPLSNEEKSKQYIDFINKLKLPGIYKVGGLGACTLINRNSLLKGVNFNPIYNLSFWGEDRHFCIRAAALGLELFVDTNYPAYHVYRNSDIAGISEFKNTQLLNNSIDLISNAIPLFFKTYNIIDYSKLLNLFTLESINEISNFINLKYSNNNKKILDCIITTSTPSPDNSLSTFTYEITLTLTYLENNKSNSESINAKCVLNKEDNKPVLIRHFLI